VMRQQQETSHWLVAAPAATEVDAGYTIVHSRLYTASGWGDCFVGSRLLWELAADRP
jgi:hypothetical protein